MSELNDLIKKLRTKDSKLNVTLNPDQTAIASIRGKLSKPVSAAELKKAPYEQTRRFVRENRALLGGINEKEELAEEKVLTSPRGMTHVVFNQKHGDARVLGGNLSIHYGADGAIELVRSKLVPGIKLPKKAKISAKNAATAAVKHAGLGAAFHSKPKPALVVADAKTLYQNGKQRHYLCWQLTVIYPNGGPKPDWIYFVDALTGKVLFRYPADRTGTGTGHYSSGAALISESSGGTYRLRDTATSAPWVAPNPAIHTYDDNGSTSRTLTDYSEDADDVWGDVVPAARVDNQRPEVDIHRFVSYVIDYYYFTHGYNGWDGAGEDAKGHGHNERYANNAYWSPTTEHIYFADGDGATRDFMCPLDTVTHEYTHGVKYYFNVLQTYDGETGALDEATSDLFGSFLAQNYPTEDPWPWHHGRQYRLDGTVGRNMSDPSRDEFGVVHYDATSDATKETSCWGGYYPDHYSIRYTGAEDYHGVHWNSPIISHAVYLMMNGGTHRLSGVTVTSIGTAPVEEILWEVVSGGYLDNSSDFSEFRTAFIEACLLLYPENLDYLATVKTAFYAVGIGPDLYVRDTLSDQGNEPGTLSCMSPDIIPRQAPADAATLADIGDITNGSLGQDIELGPDDNYVYFRIFNRGSVDASGTFRLYISPVSTFPTPATWHLVGTYAFPNVAASGGVWVPTAANECITMTSALINALGEDHYCFIGIIENDADPPPDWTLINSTSEFHDFIRKSNNYAWHNCDIVDDVPDDSGDIPETQHAFQMNGFGPVNEKRIFEADTRDFPADTRIILWMPATKLLGVRVQEARPLQEQIGVTKVAGTLVAPPDDMVQLCPVPFRQLARFEGAAKVSPTGLLTKKAGGLRALRLVPGKMHRLTGFRFDKGEKMDVRFSVKFPKGTGARDVTLAFRERTEAGVIGQMNYVFRIRKAKPQLKVPAVIKKPVIKKTVVSQPATRRVVTRRT